MESMLNRMKNKVISIVAPDLPALPNSGGNVGGGSGNATHNHQHQHNHHQQHYHGTTNSRQLPEKFTYARPGSYLVNRNADAILTLRFSLYLCRILAIDDL